MLDPIRLAQLHKPAPRYTSYPTAPEWLPMDTSHYAELLTKAEPPLSLYFHIPFCKSMCLYCGCSVVLNRKAENEERYVDYLIKEMELVCSHFTKRQRVVQLHFGGGTPTQLSCDLLEKLFKKIARYFCLDGAQEIAIEIDPRTVHADGGQKLSFLKQLGFNRVSFGVQDTNEKVQEAVKRRQSLAMTQETYEMARTCGFKGINIDLIYGLPYQTVDSFKETASHILEMRPDRIALFSYANVPWLKPHQKAIDQELLPATEDKFQIYAHARAAFIENGYVAIGMDHFALPDDELAVAYQNKCLQRNFQGYSLKLAHNMLGFGLSSIGYVAGSYVQNCKQLPSYYSALDNGLLPIHMGKQLSEEDQLRKWVIHTLMCDFELDKSLFARQFNRSFDHHFADLAAKLLRHEEEGFLVNTPEKMRITPLGELFVRIIAMTFDAYLEKPAPAMRFSQSI